VCLLLSSLLIAFLEPGSALERDLTEAVFELFDDCLTVGEVTFERDEDFAESILSEGPTFLATRNSRLSVEREAALSFDESLSCCPGFKDAFLFIPLRWQSSSRSIPFCFAIFAKVSPLAIVYALV